MQARTVNNVNMDTLPLGQAAGAYRELWTSETAP